MARAIAATPVLEGRAAERFEAYVSSAKTDPAKIRRAEQARDSYREMQARAEKFAERLRK